MKRKIFISVGSSYADMAFFFNKKDQETPKKIAHLHSLLSSSFSNVKRDVGHVFEWLNYFRKKTDYHDQQIRAIYEHLSSLDIKSEVEQAIAGHYSNLKSTVKEIIDEHYSLQDIFLQLNHLHSRVNEISAYYSFTSPKLDEIRSRIELLEQRKLEVKKNLKEKLLKKITRNSKDYVKSIVDSLIKKYGKVSALQLKEMVVEEQGLCSKSSFYRILAEIEADSDINVVWEGKEKTYFYEAIDNKNVIGKQ